LPGLVVQVESDAADVYVEAKPDVIEVHYSAGWGQGDFVYVAVFAEISRVIDELSRTSLARLDMMKL